MGIKNIGRAIVLSIITQVPHVELKLGKILLLVLLPIEVSERTHERRTHSPDQ